MSYQAAPNDNTKMSPKPLPNKAFGEVTTPSDLVVTKKPSYIIVNHPGTYAFLYNSTSSQGTTLSASAELSQLPSFVTGAVLIDSASRNKLEIQPVAWKRTEGKGDGAVGDITFVYKGGL